MAMINMKQVTGILKTVATKAAPVVKVVVGAALTGVTIFAGVKHYKKHHGAASEETMEDLAPIDDIVEENNK